MNPTSFELSIPAGQLEECFTIAIIDDKIGLEGDKTFTVRTTIIDPIFVGFDPEQTESELTIVDDEGNSFARIIVHSESGI